MLRRPTCLAVAGLFAAFALAGCHEPTEIPSYTYTATDYAFAGPAELPAGWVELVLENQGEDIHHVQVVRLQEGRTLADLEMAAAESEMLPPWAYQVAGPNAVAPGSAQRATMHLLAGPHVIICVIPDREGVPHIAHGMVKEIEVMDGESAKEPEADTTIELHDFMFQGDMAKGAQTVRAVNKAGQEHELVLFQLVGAATTQDLLAFFGPNSTGPPPFVPMGGLTGLEPGDEAYFPTDLAPGRYTMLCFFPDKEGDGAPHFAKGMVKEFEIA